MNIQYRDSVSTIATVPFAAGTILVRHELRLRRKRQKTLRQQAFRANLNRWSNLLRRRTSSTEVFQPEVAPAAA